MRLLAVTGLPRIFLASLELNKILGVFDDVNRPCGPIRIRREYNPLDEHNVVSECMVPTSETTIGVPYVCARTVSSLALKLITYNPPAQPDVVMLEQNHRKRILKVRLEA